VLDVDEGGATKTAFGERFDFAEVGSVLEGLTEGIRGALDKVAPDRVIVEFAIELAVKAGKLTGLVVEGGAKGSLGVTLEWERARSS